MHPCGAAPAGQRREPGPAAAGRPRRRGAAAAARVGGGEDARSSCNSCGRLAIMANTIRRAIWLISGFAKMLVILSINKQLI